MTTPVSVKFDISEVQRALPGRTFGIEWTFDWNDEPGSLVVVGSEHPPTLKVRVSVLDEGKAS